MAEETLPRRLIRATPGPSPPPTTRSARFLNRQHHQLTERPWEVPASPRARDALTRERSIVRSRRSLDEQAGRDGPGNSRWDRPYAVQRIWLVRLGHATPPTGHIQGTWLCDQARNDENAQDLRPRSTVLRRLRRWSARPGSSRTSAEMGRLDLGNGLAGTSLALRSWRGSALARTILCTRPLWRLWGTVGSAMMSPIGRWFTRRGEMRRRPIPTTHRASSLTRGWRLSAR
jgi:hypothetical protein